MNTLLSPSWHRVAALKPRLRTHAEIHRHRYRQETWYVIQDLSTSRHHRVSASAYQIIGLMDGSRSVDEIWRMATAQLGDEAPTQPEIVELLSQLHSADLMQADRAPDADELHRRHHRRAKRSLRSRIGNPLMLRFRLLDPDRLLERLAPWARPLLGPVGAVSWLALITLAVFTAGAHWPEIREAWASSAFSPRHLLVLWLTYPFIKALHELGHGLAVKVWGGEVHELGIMLLVFTPVPYVDASAAAAFRDKRRRMAVAAMGIGVELALAAVALFVWIAVEPGLLREVAFNTMLIGGVSSVFFNGNPLLRFDGYYVLADAIEIPNLAQRSNRHLGYLAQRHLFGVNGARSPAATSGEAVWFTVYGIASYLYRVVLACTIALYVAGKFFFVGVILAGLALYNMILLPALKGLRFLLFNPGLRRQRNRALSVTATLAGAVVLFVLFFPIPHATRAEGVVWVPEHAHVLAATEGFVRRVHVKPLTKVAANEPLMELEDPLLDATIRVLEARLEALRVEFATQAYTDRVQADLLRSRIAGLEAELEHERARSARLSIVSPESGVFVPADSRDLVGLFIDQGDVLAWVVPRGDLTVRAVVSQGDIALVREDTKAVQARFADRPLEPVAGVLTREVPSGQFRLPSKVLGVNGGGRIALDPDDQEGMRTRERIFQLDVSIADPGRSVPVGERVYLRFDHGWTPLATRWRRALRQLFLKRFGV